LVPYKLVLLDDPLEEPMPELVPPEPRLLPDEPLESLVPPELLPLELLPVPLL
jgi:hypothetical protein